MQRFLASATVLAAGVACIIHLPSCGSEDGAHTYVGRLYVANRDCLGTTSTIDVVPGDDPGDCPPICMVQPTAEAGKAVYVATMCAPYPQPDFDFSGKDPECPFALAALTRDDTCLSDGGATDPAVDAAPEAEAEAAPVDAGADGDG